MSIVNEFPAIRSQIARAMEHTANISTDTMEVVEFAARLIGQRFTEGGKLLILPSEELAGLATLTRYDLIQQYKDDQPSLPVVVLQPFAPELPLLQATLHEASTLATPLDCLLVLGPVDCDETLHSLECLATSRNIDVILLGASHLTGAAQSNTIRNLSTTEHLISVGINTDNIYSRREMSLFLLHCISDRIQAILFRGDG